MRKGAQDWMHVTCSSRLIAGMAAVADEPNYLTGVVPFDVGTQRLSQRQTYTTLGRCLAIIWAAWAALSDVAGTGLLARRVWDIGASGPCAPGDRWCSRSSSGRR